MTRTSSDVIHITHYHTSSTCATNVTLIQCTGCSRACLVSNVSEDRHHSIIIAQNCWMLRIRWRMWISIVTAHGVCQRESPCRKISIGTAHGVCQRESPCRKISIGTAHGVCQRESPCRKISIGTAHGVCQRESPCRNPEFIRCAGTLNRDVAGLPKWLRSQILASVDQQCFLYFHKQSTVRWSFGLC